MTPDKFFEDIGSSVIVNNNNCPYGGNSINVQYLHTENREIYEKLLASKDEQITLLKELLKSAAILQ